MKVFRNVQERWVGDDSNGDRLVESVVEDESSLKGRDISTVSSRRLIYMPDEY
jgi:hypothetical protein